MRSIRKILPYLVIFVVWIILFWPFFSKKLLPIPADIITGVYYPWLDYKWGYSVGVPVKNPMLSDIPSILYPWRSLAVDQIKSGQLPLWNPYYFGGMPLLANFQSAVFSYVNIFFVFFSKPIGWSLGVMTSPLLTMIFMFIYLRSRNLEKISSLFGSIVFSLSGFEIAWLEYNLIGHTVMFLPLFLLIFDKIFKEKKDIWLFLISPLIAAQIFTGYIPVIIYSYTICFFYLLFFYLLPQIKLHKIRCSTWIYFLIFWIGGLFLSGIQLVPGLELILKSIRSVDPIVSDSLASYLPVKNILTAVAPDFFGNPATGNYFGGAYFDNFYFFLGTITLIFVLYSIFFLKKNLNVQFWLIILSFSGILIFKNPLGILLEKLLFLSGGVASRALFMADFSMAVLSAFGIEFFLKQKEKKHLYYSVLIIYFLFLISVIYALMFLNPENAKIALRNLVIPVLFFTSGALCVFTAVYKQKNKKTIIFLLLLLTTAQLLYSSRKYLPFSKESMLFPKTPVIERLISEKKKNIEPFRIELGEVIPQNFLMPYELETSSGYDALLPKRTAEFFSLIETSIIPKKLSRVYLLKKYDSIYFPLLNTRFYLVKKQPEIPAVYKKETQSFFKNQRFKLFFEDKSVQVYEDSQYLPRAFFVNNFDLAKDNKDFLYLTKDNFDFSKKIILEEKPEFTFNNIPVENNTVAWVKNNPGDIKISASLSEKGMIFLGNNYFPGWKAFIDGEKTRIYRANYTFQAVQIGSGEHIIELKYFPDSFIYGFYLSFFSGFIWLFFLLRNLFLKKILNK